MTVCWRRVSFQRKTVSHWRMVCAVLSALACGLWISPSMATDITPNASKTERIAVFRENVDKILRQLHTKQGPGLAVWVEFEGEVIYKNWCAWSRHS